MCKCEICGSSNVIEVEDDEMDVDDELYLCINCYKRMFGDPPIDNSMMYT